MNVRLFGRILLGWLVLGTLGVVSAQTPPPLNPPADKSAVPPPPALSTPKGSVATPLGQVDIRNEPIVKVVANVQPAVVNINAQRTVPQYVTAYDRYFRLYRGVVNKTAQSIGSGLLVSVDGYIVTNAHVIALADADTPVGITLSTGSKYQARIVNEDDEKDLALLKIEDKTQFPYFDLSYVSPNHLGETVIALGSPEGYQNSVSHGILSAKGRTFTVEDHTYNNLIQTDAAINPGNSGGPLVDLNGGLVGINSAKLSGEAVENIGFAIPQDTVVAWVNDAMAVARGLKPAPTPTYVNILQIVRQRLGMTLKTLTPDKAAEMGFDQAGGMIITDVVDGSPAFQAGLRPNMIILSVGNRQITDEKSLPKELLGIQAGSQVTVHVIYRQQLGAFVLQRGGSATLVAQ